MFSFAKLNFHIFMQENNLTLKFNFTKEKTELQKRADRAD